MKKSKDELFLKLNREKLVNGVRNVNSLLDFLSQPSSSGVSFLTDEMVSKVYAKETKQDQMREIFKHLNCTIGYKLMMKWLKKNEPDLMKDLENDSNSEDGAPASKRPRSSAEDVDEIDSNLEKPDFKTMSTFYQVNKWVSESTNSQRLTENLKKKLAKGEMEALEKQLQDKKLKKFLCFNSEDVRAINSNQKLKTFLDACKDAEFPELAIKLFFEKDRGHVTNENMTETDEESCLEEDTISNTTQNDSNSSGYGSLGTSFNSNTSRAFSRSEDPLQSHNLSATHGGTEGRDTGPNEMSAKASKHENTGETQMNHDLFTSSKGTDITSVIQCREPGYSNQRPSVDSFGSESAEMHQEAVEKQEKGYEPFTGNPGATDTSLSLSLSVASAYCQHESPVQIPYEDKENAPLELMETDETGCKQCPGNPCTAELVLPTPPGVTTDNPVQNKNPEMDCDPEPFTIIKVTETASQKQCKGSNIAQQTREVRFVHGQKESVVNILHGDKNGAPLEAMDKGGTWREPFSNKPGAAESSMVSSRCAAADNPVQNKGPTSAEEQNESFPIQLFDIISAPFKKPAGDDAPLGQLLNMQKSEEKAQNDSESIKSISVTEESFQTTSLREVAVIPKRRNVLQVNPDPNSLTTFHCVHPQNEPLVQIQPKEKHATPSEAMGKEAKRETFTSKTCESETLSFNPCFPADDHVQNEGPKSAQETRDFHHIPLLDQTRVTSQELLDVQTSEPKPQNGGRVSVAGDNPTKREGPQMNHDSLTQFESTDTPFQECKRSDIPQQTKQLHGNHGGTELADTILHENKDNSPSEPTYMRETELFPGKDFEAEPSLSSPPNVAIDDAVLKKGPVAFQEQGESTLSFQFGHTDIPTEQSDVSGQEGDLPFTGGSLLQQEPSETGCEIDMNSEMNNTELVVSEPLRNDPGAEESPFCSTPLNPSAKAKKPVDRAKRMRQIKNNKLKKRKEEEKLLRDWAMKKCSSEQELEKVLKCISTQTRVEHTEYPLFIEDNVLMYKDPENGESEIIIFADEKKKNVPQGIKTIAKYQMWVCGVKKAVVLGQKELEIAYSQAFAEGIKEQCERCVFEAFAPALAVFNIQRQERIYSLTQNR